MLYLSILSPSELVLTHLTLDLSVQVMRVCLMLYHNSRSCVVNEPDGAGHHRVTCVLCILMGFDFL